MSRVPLWGTIFTGVITTLIAFFTTLDILADAISIGTLLAFSLVDAGVMALRYSDRTTGARPIVLIVSFLVAAFIAAMAFVRDLPLPVVVVFNALAFLLMVALWFQRTVNIPKTFKCPLVPLVPCLGIWVNFYMLSGLSFESWIRVGVWFAIGIGFYTLYGYWHSRLRLMAAGKVAYIHATATDSGVL